MADNRYLKLSLGSTVTQKSPDASLNCDPMDVHPNPTLLLMTKGKEGGEGEGEGGGLAYNLNQSDIDLQIVVQLLISHRLLV